MKGVPVFLTSFLVIVIMGFITVHPGCAGAIPEIS